jgi:hypothetical protein
MGIAGFIVFLGIIFYIPISWHLKLVFSVITLVLTIYLLYEGWCSVELLEKTRIEILKRISRLSEASTGAP